MEGDHPVLGVAVQAVAVVEDPFVVGEVVLDSSSYQDRPEEDVVVLGAVVDLEEAHYEVGEVA